MPNARILQVNVSPGGVPKRAVAQAEVRVDGITTDAVNYPKVHGGPERAVSLFSLEVIRKLQDEGHPIYPGATGENLTVAGLDWASLAAGTRLRIGDGVRLELAKPAEPCKTIAGAFADGNSKRIKAERHPGEARWYARVLAEGTVRPGDVVEVEA
ncbi:MOSC domain-containing protein [Rubrivirga sp. IMCC45206]|uniref:MOSC domain-containing protein n=1 Tax=Rubrivirga sp. IMCC45206 TaxID=3391614 RepID=UPI00399012A2